MTATILTHIHKLITNISFDSVLSLDSPMIIYCDPLYYDEVYNVGKKYDFDLSKTEIRKTYIGIFESYNRHKIFIDDISDFDESYCMLYEKVSFLRDVGLKNPFKTSHFIWMDIDSISSNYIPTGIFPKNQHLLLDKIVHFSNGKINNKCFIVPQHMLWYYHKLVDNLVRINLTNKVQISDSEIYEKIISENLDLFKVINDSQYIELLDIKNIQEEKHIEKNDRLTLIVNHYSNDISWTKRLNCNVVISNKNPDEYHLFEINLPNVGYDAISYLSYIIDNYDNLPEYLGFVQDDPFYHCMDTIEKINNFKCDEPFLPLCKAYILANWDFEKTYNYAERVDLKYNTPLKMLASMQCIASRDLILKTSKEMYEKLNSTIMHSVKSEENYCIENLWPTILNFNDELVPSCHYCRGFDGGC